MAKSRSYFSIIVAGLFLVAGQGFAQEMPSLIEVNLGTGIEECSQKASGLLELHQYQQFHNSHVDAYRSNELGVTVRQVVGADSKGNQLRVLCIDEAEIGIIFGNLDVAKSNFEPSLDQ